MSTAEILLAASKHIGRPLRLGYCVTTMDISDAIAEVCPRNPWGATAAFRHLRAMAGTDNLILWQNGKTDAEIVEFLQDAARKIAS